MGPWDERRHERHVGQVAAEVALWVAAGAALAALAHGWMPPWA